MRLIAKVIRINTLNFTAIDLYVYETFKITRVLFFGTQCSNHTNDLQTILLSSYNNNKKD